MRGTIPGGAVLAATILELAMAASAAGRAPGDPIRLVWTEGDVAGLSTIYDPDIEDPIGFIEYHQRIQGDVLTTERVARFRDGSSDEDQAEARVGGRLEALSGRSIIRDTDGEPIVDVRIDVLEGHLSAEWGRGADRRKLDEDVHLPAGTYWGPLVFIVLKNYDANAENGQLVFRTVAPTPRPMVIDMALVRGPSATLERTGANLSTVRYDLRPTVHWLIDPVIRLVAPRASFSVLPGAPPALARYAGPRNYGRQPIVIQ